MDDALHIEVIKTVQVGGGSIRLLHAPLLGKWLVQSYKDGQYFGTEYFANEDEAHSSFDKRKEMLMSVRT